MEGFYHASIASVRDSDLLNVCFGLLCRLKSDISRGPRSANSGREQMQQHRDYSITSSASASTLSGNVRPSALAVLRLMISSNLVA
jgi:hypothetical protein